MNDPAPSDDWASIAQGSGAGQERRGQDQPTGSSDDSFGNGTKEDTAVPSVIDGSIPNNKSDLSILRRLSRGAGRRQKFLNIYWTRVQEPSGTTNMDFEFNKSEAFRANGVTPVRTAGDILIQYDLARAGPRSSCGCPAGSRPAATARPTVPNAPCWGERVDLDAAGDGTGSINLTPIAAADCRWPRRVECPHLR